ncbi:hypothetical protein ABE527_02305 [Brucella sp. TWI432]
MARVGIDATTGRCLFGWDHCLQSIITILTTELRERVQLRGFGSNIPNIIDRPQTVETIIDLYVATAQALEPRIVEGRQLGEPGFVFLRGNVDAATPGTVKFQIGGVFFENGHLGDYSNPVERTAIIALNEIEGGVYTIT